MNKELFISVASVLKDNADILEQYLSDVSGVLSGHFDNYEIVLIDNGSTDGTIQKCQELLGKVKNTRLILLSREYDPEVAFTAALSNSIGDYVVIMDADTDPPDLIPGMVDIAATEADIVTAEYTRRKDEGPVYRLFTRLFFWLINLLTNQKLDPKLSNYICFNRKTVNSILQVKDRVRYMKFIKAEIGFSHASIAYNPINRSGKRKRRSFLDKSMFAIEILISTSGRLIRIMSLTAFAACLVNLGYVIYSIGVKLLSKGVVQGWASTSVVMALMFAILFFILGIVLEFLALIYKETRKGPLFHVVEEYSSTTLFDDFEKKNVT